MNHASTSPITTVTPSTRQPARILRGLLWREWLANGRTITAFILIWLVAVFVLQLFFHPLLLLVFGMCYAVIVGHACGGGEASEGVEEFAFALPATRRERYLTRLLVGGGVLLVLQAVGVAAIALDLPQALWGLIVDSGFTEPFPPVTSWEWYGITVALPVATFATIFACAANAGTMGRLPITVLGLVVPGLAMAMGAILENWALPSSNGSGSSTGLLILTTTAVLVLGLQRYLTKEGQSHPGRPGVSGGFWILLALLMLMALAFLTVFALKVAVSSKTADHQITDEITHRGSSIRVGSGSSDLQTTTVIQLDDVHAPTPSETDVSMPPATSTSESTAVAVGSLPFLIVIGILIATLVLVYRRIGRQHLMQDRARHPVVRVFCAVIAGAIMLAIAIASWRDAVASYPVESLMVKLPARALKVPSHVPEHETGTQQELATARFMLRVFVGTLSPAGFVPHHHQEWEVRWPEQQGRYAVGWQDDDLEVDYRFNIERVMNLPTPSDQPSVQGAEHRPILAVRGQSQLKIQAASYSRSQSRTGIITEGGTIEHSRASGSDHTGPWSIRLSSTHPVVVFVVVTPLTIDEALADRPAAEFLDAYQDRLRTSVDSQQNDIPVVTSFAWGGFGLFAHLGLVSLPLMLVVALTAQCFRSRMIAATGTVIAVLFAIIAIERLVLDVHLARAADVTATKAQRLIAGDHANGSFFFRTTASEQLGGSPQLER